MDELCLESNESFRRWKVLDSIPTAPTNISFIAYSLGLLKGLQGPLTLSDLRGKH